MPTTHTVDCSAGEKIQDKIAIAKPGDTILVSGNCAARRGHSTGQRGRSKSVTAASTASLESPDDALLTIRLPVDHPVPAGHLKGEVT